MKKHTITWLFLLWSACLFAQEKLSLDGEWQFAIDRENIGTSQAWYNRTLDETIILPGSMLTNGKGDEITVSTQWIGSLYDSSYYFNPYMEKYRKEGNIKLPFFLTPDKHYVGYAWYRKIITIPKNWKQRSVSLFLERPHIETTVYINGHEAGHGMSLSVPHDFDITPYILAGKENTIAIKVYNGIENVGVGQDSHSVTDQTQGDWNGIIGRIELQAKSKIHVQSAQVFPNIQQGSIKVKIKMSNEGKHTLTAIVEPLDKKTAGDKITAKKTFNGNYTEEQIRLSNVQLWDEFNPNLYKLTLVTEGEKYETTFGMREITIQGKQFYLNGRPIWLRGTVENCDFPLTGYPPTDVASWEAVFRKCKEYGLNTMRFHSFCPPEAAFEAADHIGFYLQPEGPSWPNHGIKLGNGMTIDTYLMDETKAMTEAYGNHPSFLFLACGNEPAGNWVEWVTNFVNYWKNTDCRRVYTGASVGGGWDWDPASQYHVKGGARGLTWNTLQPQSIDNFDKEICEIRIKGAKQVYHNEAPFVTHEQGQWCAFPDLKEINQYTGVNKARNFEIFRDMLRDNGMISQAEKFLYASGKLQTLAYKFDIERILRTKDYAGFQLLSLNDYSGQGTALVGVLNVFWKEKGYCTAENWREFCQPIVPLGKFPKFTYSSDEILQVPVELYNAYKEPLIQTQSLYSIHDDRNHEYAHGILSTQDLPLGKNIELGVVNFPLHQFTHPLKLTLTIVSIPQQEVPMRITNHYDFWVYPANEELTKVQDVYISETLNDQAIDILYKGGKVLLTAAGKITYGSDIKQNYLPVFWNTSWFKMNPPHTTGAYIQKEHPMFRDFPTDDWSNLNWWELLNNAQVMNFAEFPQDFQPIIQSIDTWHVSRKIGMLFEANVLNGRLLMTSMDISTDLDKRIVARQMRNSILQYMQSDDFRPTLSLDLSIVRNLYEKQAQPVNMYTNESPEELKPKIK